MTTPPTFKPQRFTVHLLPEGTDPKLLDDPDYDFDRLPELTDGHRVTVLWADQLRAEAEGAKHGITGKSHAGLATVWVWAAMVRTGRTTDRFQTFRARVVDVGDGDKQPDQATQEAEADDPAMGPT